eukprot:2766327-Rhodomonas_salina.2
MSSGARTSTLCRCVPHVSGPDQALHDPKSDSESRMHCGALICHASHGQGVVGVDTVQVVLAVVTVRFATLQSWQAAACLLSLRLRLRGPRGPHPCV